MGNRPTGKPKSRGGDAGSSPATSMLEVHVLPSAHFFAHRPMGCWCGPTLEEHECGTLIVHEHRGLDAPDMWFTVRDDEPLYRSWTDS